MAEKRRIRARNPVSRQAGSGRFTGNVPAREDHKPLYSDTLRGLRPSSSISTLRRSILSLQSPNDSRRGAVPPRFACVATGIAPSPHRRTNSCGRHPEFAFSTRDLHGGALLPSEGNRKIAHFRADAKPESRSSCRARK